MTVKHSCCVRIGLALAALVFTNQLQHAPCAADPPSEVHRTLTPEDRISFGYSAGGIREAAGLLADRLGLQVLVAEPQPDSDLPAGPDGKLRTEDAQPETQIRTVAPAERAAGSKATPGVEGKPDPAPTAARRIPFHFVRKPLKDLLDAMGSAFDYAWEEAQGIYVFRPRQGHQQAALRILDEVHARGGEPPTREELDALCARLDGLGIGPEGVPVGQLDPESQSLLRRVLRSHYLAELRRSIATIESARGNLSHSQRITFESFAQHGKIQVVAPDATTLELKLLVPSPESAGEWLYHLWSRTDPNHAPRPGAAQGGAG
ncbi:MAG: hypothetical protein GX774_08800 [Armatimonadetes bacterium]|nr:hypothetical protein [Armatimonadota bacterium]